MNDAIDDYNPFEEPKPRDRLAGASPAVRQAVEDGELTLSDAAEIAHLHADAQDDALEAIREGEANTIEQAKKQVKGAGPKKPFDWKKLESNVGQVARMVDELAERYGRKWQHTACVALLRDLAGTINNWRGTVKE